MASMVEAGSARPVDPELLEHVRRIGRLLDDEVELRSEARRLELDPSRSEDARRLFDLAGRVRTERLGLLDRWLTR